MKTYQQIIQQDNAGIFIPAGASTIRPTIPSWLKDRIENGSTISEFCMQLTEKFGSSPACSGKTDFCSGENVTVEMTEANGVFVVTDQIGRYKEAWFGQDKDQDLSELFSDSTDVDLAHLWALAVTGSSAEIARLLGENLSSEARIAALSKLVERRENEKPAAIIEAMTTLVDAAILIAGDEKMHAVERWQILRAIGSRVSHDTVVVGTLISTLGEYRPDESKKMLKKLLKALLAFKVAMEEQEVIILKSAPRDDR